MQTTSDCFSFFWMDHIRKLLLARGFFFLRKPCIMITWFAYKQSSDSWATLSQFCNDIEGTSARVRFLSYSKSLFFIFTILENCDAIKLWKTIEEWLRRTGHWMWSERGPLVVLKSRYPWEHKLLQGEDNYDEDHGTNSEKILRLCLKVLYSAQEVRYRWCFELNKKKNWVVKSFWAGLNLSDSMSEMWKA